MTMVPVDCTADYARSLTDRIKVAVEATWHLIAEAYQIGAWSALGYQSWDDYTTREFGTARLRLPREDREDVVMSLREAGLSVRAIAAVTGDHRETVRRAITSTDSFESVEDEVEPALITGVNGKTYRASVPSAPRRNPLPSLASSAGWELRRSVERLERVFDDDRFDTYKEQVATELRGHLLNVIEVCQDLANRLA